MPTKRILPALAVSALMPLLAWAQALAPGPAPNPANPTDQPTPTEAEKLLDAALEKVRGIQAVSANLREDIKMLGQAFKVEGRFLKGPNHRLYLQLELTGPGDSSGSMLQVCDGTTLYEYKQIIDSADVRKRILSPIFEKLGSADSSPELRDQVLAQMGFAGPDALLAGLRKAIEFNQKEDSQRGGKKVWILRGRWKDRGSLSGLNQPPLPPTGPLPPYVPSLAAVWIGQDDGWPYRIELYGQSLGIMAKKEDRVLGPDGRPVGRPLSIPDQPPSEIRLAYTDVRLNPNLDASQFFWQPPGGVHVVDETPAILNDLTAVLAQRAAQRKSEAAKTGAAKTEAAKTEAAKADPALPTPIPVPRPAAEPPDTPPPVEALPSTTPK